MTQSKKIELFAIVELFGHSKIAGQVMEHNIGSASFVRIDVPETEEQPNFTRIVHPNAIYAINPVTKEVMTEMAKTIAQKPIQAWDIREMQKKLLALKTSDVKYC